MPLEYLTASLTAEAADHLAVPHHRRLDHPDVHKLAAAAAVLRDLHGCSRRQAVVAAATACATDVFRPPDEGGTTGPTASSRHQAWEQPSHDHGCTHDPPSRTPWPAAPAP